MKSDTVYTFPDPWFRRSRFEHAIHLAILTIGIVTVATGAVFYSLGYQVNWRTFSIQRTGLISLNTDIGTVPAEVKIDGAMVAAEIPYRTAPLFPGVYTVSIAKPGFKPWERTVTVEPNKVNNFPSIILIKEQPVEVATPSNAARLLSESRLDRRDIEVRENELWIEGKFVTRFSQDILSAAWYPDNEHVVYQVGNELWMVSLDGLRSDRIITASSPGLIEFQFTEKGRVLVYRTGGLIQAVELY
ncbi:MAG: hypothetical protein K0S20_155 [Patescibacteria group bacterium]|jgi:hypothetical protein|nr:hypothetical protein [Patescibacteria group bacterium]